MALDAYRQKRDFHKTPEPRGRATRRKSTGLAFVVQKHAASNLHYDLRLELNGVLLSWAVPKGPSLDPADKRLAVHVEDHPLEYGGFEGVIPARQYGSGAVLVWDRGSWIPSEDPVAGYARGRLKFTLDGEKLKGGWILVRGRGGNYGDRAWLLIKENDEFARRGADADIVESAPDSVASGRTLDDIAADRDRVWRSDRSVKENVRSGVTKPRRSRVSPTTKSRQTADRAGSVSVTGIPLSHPDKLLYPDAGLSKLDLARYYETIGDWIVPHLKDRPLALVRCPDGWKGQCFYQKHADQSVNAAVPRIAVPEGKGRALYLMADSVPAAVSLVQWGTLELHPWGSRRPRLDRPDRLTFDFDPDAAVSWKELAEGVVLLRTLLEEIGVTGFLKTTGGKGLHVVVPIRPTIDWDRAKAFTKATAELLATTFPDRFTATMSRSRRKGRIFVDYLRNTEGATAVCAYSPRARANAPVATPIEWDELRRDLRFDHFNVGNLPQRLRQLEADPWRKFFAVKQSITIAMLKRVGAPHAR
jgi:bifunctional non-homologous end joining protein LigD